MHMFRVFFDDMLALSVDKIVQFLSDSMPILFFFLFVYVLYVYYMFHYSLRWNSLFDIKSQVHVLFRHRNIRKWCHCIGIFRVYANKKRVLFFFFLLSLIIRICVFSSYGMSLWQCVCAIHTHKTLVLSLYIHTRIYL